MNLSNKDYKVLLAKRDILEVNNNSLGKADKIFVICIHVCKLYVDEQNKLVFGSLFVLANSCADNPLGLVAQPRIASHLDTWKSHLYAEVTWHKILAFNN